METINEIVSEMRDFADTDSQTIGRDVLRRKIQHFADRIKVAISKTETTTPTCKESLQVGNAAKMRESLEQVAYIVRMFDDIDNVRSRVKQVMTAVLTTPPRNCDKCLTPKDAMLAHLEEVYEGEKVEFGDYEWCEFVKWLFAEAKGDAE